MRTTQKSQRIEKLARLEQNEQQNTHQVLVASCEKATTNSTRSDNRPPLVALDLLKHPPLAILTNPRLVEVREKWIALAATQ